VLFLASRREHYEIHLTIKPEELKTGEQLVAARVYDRHENVSAAKTVPAHPIK
jgi:hypothetical protein